MFGGQGTGKADNWRARPREGGQLAGRSQGRRTTGGQGPGKADNWRAGHREGGQLAGMVLQASGADLRAQIIRKILWLFAVSWPGLACPPAGFFKLVVQTCGPE